MDVERDRISELPDHLIHHILSFLPIKSIASTTVLSREWNNLWLSLPILYFTQWRSPTCENQIVEDSDSDTDSDTNTKQDEYQVTKDSPPVDLAETNRFMDFLDKVIFSDKLDDLKKFCLKTDSMYFDQDRVKEWINSIVRRNVEKLVLSIKCSGPRVVPLELFYCESLTILDLRFQNKQVLDQPPLSTYNRLRYEYKARRISKLFYCESLTILDLRFQNKQVLDQPPLSTFSFPKLKRLRLSFIHFKDKFFSNCPVLDHTTPTGLDVICFELPRLKFFDFCGFGRSFGRECIENVKVKFDTPNLLYLTWFDYLPEEFIVVDSFPSLVEAGIRYSFSEGYTESRYDSFYNFVEKLSHVKHLMISDTYLRPKIDDDLSFIPRSYPSFRNLVSLEVGVIYYSQIGSLYDIVLQHSPNLTSLSFHKLFSSPEVVENPLPLNIVPSCLLLCLKYIEFQNFDGNPQEMEVVKLFLESAQVLQKITLESSSYNLEYLNKKKPTAEEVEDADNKILEQLQAFSWASSDCVVEFASP
ncbi:hypothetical protein MKX03_015866 [Papaver bracteatum]|nr:hypothetical protein MKX03_015866 [Papaver bracteatum]